MLCVGLWSIALFSTVMPKGGVDVGTSKDSQYR